MPIVEISSVVPGLYNVEINSTITGTTYNVEISPFSSSVESGSYYGILLGELKYTGYAYGDLVPYNTPVDGFFTWADYGQAHTIVSSSAGTSLKAARLPTTAETASSVDGSRYALQALVPSSLRNNLSQIRYRAYIRCPPTSASCAMTTADGIRYLFIWGNNSIRTYGGTMFTPFNAIGFYDNGALLITSSMFPQYVEGEWYIHDFNIKMSPSASEGFINAVIYRASDNSVLTSLYWTGSTGNEYDTSSYAGDQWGDHASVWGMSSTFVSSTDITRFPVMGPVYVYDSA